MQEDTSADNYLLGQTPDAVQRLLVLGQMLNPFTRRVLAEAGITTGMRVLDIGCGPGDVSLIAGELVGASGSVLGVDAGASVLGVAQSRAEAAGLAHVSFRVGNLLDIQFDQGFDAVIGRLILMHLPEPAAVLRRLAQHVRPGGVVAFQEYDLSGHDDAYWPTSPLWEQVWRLSTLPWQRAGGDLHRGLQLYALFREAGLPAPRMGYEAAIGGGPDWSGYEMWAETVRVFLPLIRQFEMASEEEIDIDTLADRLRAETVSGGGVARTPILVSAWTRIPS